MSQSWIDRIAEAQTLRFEWIGGRRYERRRYGSESRLVAATCRDCGVARGKLHVVGCTVEQCGRCGGQAITCNCDELEAIADARGAA